MKRAIRRPGNADRDALRLLLGATVAVDLGQHWCNDEHQIVLNRIKPFDFVLIPLRGAMRLRHPGGSTDLRPGRCLAIAAGVEHDGQRLGDAPLEAVTLHCRVSSPAAPRLLTAFDQSLLPCPAPWRRAATEAVALGDRDRPAANVWLATLLRQLLVDAVRGGIGLDPDPVNPLLTEAVRLLEAHPERTVAAVAARCGCSTARLRQLFAAAFGHGPADHRAARRLREACRLLRADDATVASIAEASGFGTTRAMQQAFRRHLGTTPQAYRESGAI